MYINASPGERFYFFASYVPIKLLLKARAGLVAIGPPRGRLAQGTASELAPDPATGELRVL